MLFQRRFHEGIRTGQITCTVRIWQRLHVKLGGRCALGGGALVVDKIRETDLDDLTPSLARRCGFPSLADLLQTAKHGPGERVFIIDFITTVTLPHDRNAKRAQCLRQSSRSSCSDSRRWIDARRSVRGR